MSFFKQLLCDHEFNAFVEQPGECYYQVTCQLCGKKKVIEIHDWIIDRTCEYSFVDPGTLRQIPAIKYFLRCKRCIKFTTRVSS